MRYLLLISDIIYFRTMGKEWDNGWETAGFYSIKFDRMWAEVMRERKKEGTEKARNYAKHIVMVSLE